MNKDQMNFLIKAYNARLMSVNDFGAVYCKEPLTAVKAVQLIYTAGVPIPGERPLEELVKDCDRIIKRIN